MTIHLHYRNLKHIYSLHPQQGHVENDLYHRQIVRDYRQRLLTGISPHFAIETNHYGKPLSRYDPQLSFNHSHSRGYYALAYSVDVIDLGIDIEDFSRSVNMLALARRVFHPEEYQCWQQTGFDRTFWFKVWTIKEALLKAHGMGIRLQLNSLNTRAHPTWDFGRIEHPLLGQFDYQCLEMPYSMLTVAYRCQNRVIDLQTLQLF